MKTPLISAFLSLLTPTFLAQAAGVHQEPPQAIAEEEKKESMELRWDDRRPMVALFVARSEWRTPKNPGGYLGPQIDTTTDEGMKIFREQLVALADQVVKTLRKVDGQGVIVWDIEGQEQTGMVYVGDPRILPQYAPSMDKVADVLFARIAEAGFRTGVCVRPNDIFLNPPASVPKWGKWGYRLYKDDQADAAEEIISRMQYARKRWGCSLFYMDTNFYDQKTGDSYRQTLMSPEMIRHIHQKTPGSLLIPEHEEAGYYAASAPYNQIDMVGLTPPAIRQAFPGVFSVNMMSQYHMPIRWEEIVSGVRDGDVLLFTFNGPEFFADSVAAAYREAAIRKDIRPVEASDAPLAELKSQTASKRLAAAEALTAHPDQKAVPALIEAAQHDPEWSVKRAAFAALAAAGTPESDAFLSEFLKRESTSTLAPHVALFVGKYNPHAVTLLTGILDDASDENREARYNTVYGLLQINSPDVIPPLLTVTRDKYSTNRWWGMRVLASKLKTHPSREAFEQLLWQRTEEKNKGLKPQMDEALKAMAATGIGTKEEIAETQSEQNAFAQWNDWISRNADRGRRPSFMNDPALAPLFGQAERELVYRNQTLPRPGEGLGFEETLALAAREEPAIRYKAVESMIRSGDERYAEPLSRLLQAESDWVVRRKILEALVELRFTPGIPHIEKAGARDQNMKLFADAAVSALQK